MENKLDKNNIENLISLTSMQQEMLFLYINDKLNNEYHEQLSLNILGDIKLDLLQKSWDFVIQTNEMLRAVFRWKGLNSPIQIILKKHQPVIKYRDFTMEADKEKALENIKMEDLYNRIDITKETLRIYLCKLGSNNYEMIISNHHILFDGWSNGIILRELMSSYNKLYEGKELIKANKTKFSEFIKYINTIDKLKEKKYWINYLGNIELKNDVFSSNVEKRVFNKYEYGICFAKTKKIRKFCEENNIALSALLYGVWGITLAKINDSNEYLFGTTVSGRNEGIKSIDNMVGLFINAIPLRVRIKENCSFIELIHEIDKALAERKEFENTALSDIREYCGLSNGDELFNSIVTIENYPLDLNMNNENKLYIQNFSMEESTNYNMLLQILTFNDIKFKFIYNSLVVEEFFVGKLMEYMENILDTLLINKNINISEIGIIIEEEKNKIIYEFNDKLINYSRVI